MFSLLMSGHTCGDHCWHAKELVCRCSCGGANHGILLTKDGKQPTRTRKIDGNFYELVSIIAHDPQSAPITTIKKAHAELVRVSDERFPGLYWNGYGAWRTEKTMPVVERSISDTQGDWPEVKKISGARTLIWARPVGTRYLVAGPNHTTVYADTLAASATDAQEKAELC